MGVGLGQYHDVLRPRDGLVPLVAASSPAGGPRSFDPDLSRLELWHSLRAASENPPNRRPGDPRLGAALLTLVPGCSTPKREGAEAPARSSYRAERSDLTRVLPFSRASARSPWGFHSDRLIQTNVASSLLATSKARRLPR